MIVGQVNARLQARVDIEMMAAQGPSQRLQAVLDTGFSGSLALPMSVVRSLGLARVGLERGTLADGSVATMEVHEGTVLWCGRALRVEVQATDSVPLLGMELLHPFRVRLDVTPGGAVEMTPLAP